MFCSLGLKSPLALQRRGGRRVDLYDWSMALVPAESTECLSWKRSCAERWCSWVYMLFALYGASLFCSWKKALFVLINEGQQLPCIRKYGSVLTAIAVSPQIKKPGKRGVTQLPSSLCFALCLQWVLPQNKPQEDFLWCWMGLRRSQFICQQLCRLFVYCGRKTLFFP